MLIATFMLSGSSLIILCKISDIQIVEVWVLPLDPSYSLASTLRCSQK